MIYATSVTMPNSKIPYCNGSIRLILTNIRHQSLMDRKKYFSKEKSRRVNVERYVATVNRLRAWDCYVE